MVFRMQNGLVKLSDLATVVFLAGALASTAAAADKPAIDSSVSGRNSASSEGSSPTYADFVHMALMSDGPAYLAEAETTGLAYVSATGNEAVCKKLYDISTRGNEFAVREYLAEMAVAARQAIADLPNRPRRLTMPVETTYQLGDYDFERKGFPLSPLQAAQVLAPGLLSVAGGSPSASCQSAYYRLYSSLPGRKDVFRSHFFDLRSEHAGVGGAGDFLPMSPEKAKVYRDSNTDLKRPAGRPAVIVRAKLIVEPRAQGRGPLKGQIVDVTAHDAQNGQLLHRWDVPDAETPPRAQHDRLPWSNDLLASLIAPAAEPHLDHEFIDNAATRYFESHALSIKAGNAPPQSPLPIDEIRGREPREVAVLNRAQLRAALKAEPAALPIRVFFEHKLSALYNEQKGLYFNPPIENDLQEARGEAALSKLILSKRDLPIYRQLIPVKPWDMKREQVTFKQTVVSGYQLQTALELDRVVSLPAVPFSIEQAAAHKLLTSRRDIVLRWEFDVGEVRVEDPTTVVLSATMRGLSYRWANDNALITDIALDTFPTVKQLREQADAALPPGATADNVTPPPPGTRLGAEMMDLLQLRYQPQTVDDRVIERMMITRSAYEATEAAAKRAPIWGNFFRDPLKRLSAEDWAARRSEFRRWSEARAGSLPSTMTLTLPLADTPSGKAPPFERHSPLGKSSLCLEKGNSNVEKDVAAAKICAFLDAAWKQAEPILFLPGLGDQEGPRSSCGNAGAEPYCREMYNAHVAMKLSPSKVKHDVVRLDRLPAIDPSVRSAKGRLVLEIVVEPSGILTEQTWPADSYVKAVQHAQEFGRTYGLKVYAPDRHALSEPVMQLAARANSARVIDSDTGAVVAEPPLAPPPSLPLAMLEVAKPPSAPIATGRNVLGISLGMSFDEADKLIREHMKVAKVLTADRKKQLGVVSGEIIPYTSGRIYVTESGDEMIAIFDEPPSAPDSVLGLWRILRLPHGATDPAKLKATLTQRNGEPRVSEVSLPFMRTGLAFLWSDYEDPACRVITFEFQTGLWQDETGDTSWLPPGRFQPLYPNLHGSTGTHGYINLVSKKPLPPGSFCTTLLGVRYAATDGKNRGEHNGVELVTWLTDQRTYAAHYFNSRAAPPVASTADNTDVEIKH